MVFGTLVGGFVSGWLQRPLEGGDQQRAAHHQSHPLVHGLPGRGDHGLWRAHGARLHLRAGALRRRGALGRLVGCSCSPSSRGAYALAYFVRKFWN